MSVDKFVLSLSSQGNVRLFFTHCVVMSSSKLIMACRLGFNSMHVLDRSLTSPCTAWTWNEMEHTLSSVESIFINLVSNLIFQWKMRIVMSPYCIGSKNYTIVHTNHVISQELPSVLPSLFLKFELLFLQLSKRVSRNIVIPAFLEVALIVCEY